MNLTNIHNPVFDFTVAPLSNGEYDFSLKYKGKEMDIEESEYDNDSFATELNQSPDEFMDFEAEYFPNLHSFNLTFEPSLFHDTCSIAEVRRKNDIIRIEYFISFSDLALTSKYNPFLLMKKIFAKVNKNGMEAIDRIDSAESYLCEDVNYEVPAKGNLLNHFRNGIKILEQAYDESVKEMEKL